MKRTEWPKIAVFTHRQADRHALQKKQGPFGCYKASGRAAQFHSGPADLVAASSATLVWGSRDDTVEDEPQQGYP